MMSKRLKAFAYEVLTSGQSHGEIRTHAENVYEYFRHVKIGYASLSPLLVHSILRAGLKIQLPPPCCGSNHKFMLSFHFSSVEAIYMVSHDCTPISAHSNVSLTIRALLRRSCGGVLIMEFKSSHVPSLILNIRRISSR